MAAVISAESRGHQFAIADAGPVHLPWSVRKSMVASFYFGNKQEAVNKAQELINAGHTVSLGPAQVNDRNLKRLGITLEQAFDACTNIAGGGKILTEFYERAVAKFGRGEQALRAALSAYNSGDWSRGEKDGYVSLVTQQVGRPLVLRTGGLKTASMSQVGGAVAGQDKKVLWWQAIKKSSRRGVKDFALASDTFQVQE
jgi:type IV secretion system protein VirB1